MTPLRIVSGLLLALAVTLTGCETTTQSGAVGVDRKQLLLVSSGQLNQMAAQSYAQLQNEAAKKGALNQDAAMLQRVRAIASRLRPHTATFRPDAPNWAWEVNVIHSNQLNAFCMPGGKIMFYSGLITQLQLTDDEIAIVMGHEIAHALREHSREQVSQAMLAQTLIGFGTHSEQSADRVGGAYQILVAPSFNRTDETEADRIGLELSARSGYDPRAGITLWKKMMNANKGGQIPEFLSSHPADANRVQEIESLLPTVMPLYEQARRR